MCLTKQETRKVAAGWASLMVVLLIQMGTGLWWASDMNRRILYIEEGMKQDKFTQAEGDNHSFQINQMLTVMGKMRVTLDNLNDQIREANVFDRTHTHGENGIYEP